MDRFEAAYASKGYILRRTSVGSVRNVGGCRGGLGGFEATALVLVLTLGWDGGCDCVGLVAEAVDVVVWSGAVDVVETGEGSWRLEAEGSI